MERITMDKNYLVTKSNELITKRYELSVEEQRIVLLLASMVQPDDEDFKEYKLKVQDFTQFFEVNDDSKYKTIPKICNSLRSKGFTIEDEKEIINVGWLADSKYIKKDGIVIIRFSPYLKPYLLGLKEYFTTYKLGNILKLKSKYSIRLYEILKSSEFKKVLEIEIDELRDMLMCDKKSYDIFQNFKTRVLEPAKKELNEFTDIKFEYESFGDGRKHTMLRFKIEPKEVKKRVRKPKTKQETVKNGSFGDYSQREYTREFWEQIEMKAVGIKED
jgi:plasmid replication initiation protein